MEYKELKNELNKKIQYNGPPQPENAIYYEE